MRSSAYSADGPTQAELRRRYPPTVHWSGRQPQADRIPSSQHSDVTNVLGKTATAISGIGDHAVWDDNGGLTAVTLGAWQGNVSCLVQPDSDVTNDTVTYTGKPPFTKISAADGAAYAAKLGKVCTDVFAAAG
jgi:hypothetical protein